jgi:hypothetical protein
MADAGTRKIDGDREGAVVEFGVAGFDGSSPPAALGRDACQARFQRGGIAPELCAFVFGEQRQLLGLLILLQLGLDGFLKLVEHGADVVDFLLLAGLQRVGRNLRRSFERASTACRMAPAHGRSGYGGIEQRICASDGLA